VLSVTNEPFKHIIYYPIFSKADHSKIVAVFEVAYKQKLSANQTLLTDDIQQYLDQFRFHLGEFNLRLGSFSRNIENIFMKSNTKRICKAFQDWKQLMIFTQYKEQFQQNQYNAL
jgi:hypothetical protein